MYDFTMDEAPKKAPGVSFPPPADWDNPVPPLPTDPVAPFGTVAPYAPAPASGGPAEPGAPEAPAKPPASAGPAVPLAHAESAGPTAPDTPAGSGGSAWSAARAVPLAPAEPAARAVPLAPAAPAVPGGPVLPQAPVAPYAGLYERAHPPAAQQRDAKPRYPGNALGGWALALGIVSWAGVVTWGALILLAVPAVVCGILAVWANHRKQAHNKVVSWLGLAAGLVGATVNVYVLIVVLTLW